MAKDYVIIRIDDKHGILSFRKPGFLFYIPGEYSSQEQYFDQEHFRWCVFHLCSNSLALCSQVCVLSTSKMEFMNIMGKIMSIHTKAMPNCQFTSQLRFLVA